MNTHDEVLRHYNLKGAEVTTIGSGLINRTWLVKKNSDDYILQEVNKKIFKLPRDISFNICYIDDYLKKNHPGYPYTSLIKTSSGDDMLVTEDDKYFRLFKYVKDSVTHTKLQKPEQAFEAAKQFGKFAAILDDLDATKLKIVLPDFHNLTLRYQQFVNALQNGNKERIAKATEEIKFLEKNKNIDETYLQIKSQHLIKTRVTHHDTKISNVLFDQQGKGICVIDLDTIMPGYFISDVGDMMRTYLSEANEEESDFSKVVVRVDFFKAIVDGYLSEMQNILSPTERAFFIYSGKFMIYMQALRFMTDYILGDVYYHTTYPEHNFVRGGNQIALLSSYLKNEGEFERILSR